MSETVDINMRLVGCTTGTRRVYRAFRQMFGRRDANLLTFGYALGHNDGELAVKKADG